MTYKKHIVILFLLCSQFCFAQNLIWNGSFEDSLGNPSLDGWVIGDTSWGSHYFSFMNDVPSGGGTWSIKLNHLLIPLNYIIWYYSPQIPGTYIYQLTFYTKNIQLGGQYSPYIGMGIKKNSSEYVMLPNEILNDPVVYFFDTTINYWHQVTLIDSITSTYQDTIAVVFWGGSISVPGEYDSTYVDLFELTKELSTNTSPETLFFNYIGNFNNKIFFKNENHEYVNFILYNSFGQIVKIIGTNDNFINIEKEKEKLNSGLYFYKIIKSKDNKDILKSGKFVLITH